MSKKYDNIINVFNSKNCSLLTTYDEFNEIVKNSNNFKLNYIASCGHTHNVFYNVFKNRNTGVVCPSCKHKINCDKKKELIKNNIKSKICNIEQEFYVIKKLENKLKDTFNFIKAFDGCKIDVIYKPKHILTDEWVGIQVKTTGKINNNTYGFNVNGIYDNCLILLYCCENDNVWLIPENVIKNQKKISIGIYKSKYEIYDVSNNLIDKLNELYIITNKYTFELLNTPKNIYQKREQEFRLFREKQLKFLNFCYDELEGTVYDFKVDGLKIQEKVSGVVNNYCIFHLYKNNGVNCKSQYNSGDNDFYWLNSEKKDFFLVIPEKVMVDNGYINNSKKYTLKITFKDVLCVKLKWLQSYLFNYETINQDNEKNRLINLLGKQI